MPDRERRAPTTEETNAAKLRAGLTVAQLRALDTLEQFGWVLKFVRRPLFLDPVPVVSNKEGDRIAVLEGDGSINDAPGFKIRD